MRRFYAPPTDFASGIVTLSAEQAKHARDVLRLVPGDEVQVFDGAGGEFLCRIESLSKTAAVLTVVSLAAPLEYLPVPWLESQRTPAPDRAWRPRPSRC